MRVSVWTGGKLIKLGKALHFWGQVYAYPQGYTWAQWKVEMDIAREIAEDY